MYNKLIKTAWKLENKVRVIRIIGLVKRFEDPKLFFFWDFKTMTFIQTKTKTIYPGTPRSQYKPVFPQPKHADLTSL